MAAVMQNSLQPAAEDSQQSEFQRLLQQPAQIRPSFEDASGFELLQRMAKMWASSALVPKDYSNNVANCAIALNMASRMRADPLMVMQNLVSVHGRPTWSAQFLIATVNSARDENGRRMFSPLRYEFFGARDTDGWGCRAYAIEQATGERLVGADVTIAIAKKEGWYSRSGSKWQSIPQQMLMYRAASWWTRAYAPDLSMGLHTADEADDMGASVPPPRSPSASPMLEAMRAVERDMQSAVDATTTPPADMDPATGEVPPPATKAESEPPAESPAEAATLPPEVDDFLTEIGDCSTPEELDALSKRGATLAKKYPDHRQAIGDAGRAKRDALAADAEGFGGGE